MEFLLSLLVAVYAFYFMRKVKAKQIDGPFTTNEKIQVIVTLLLSTLLSWSIYYFGWKNTLPQKAHQAKKYFLYIIGALVAIAVIGLIIAVVITSFQK